MLYIHIIIKTFYKLVYICPLGHREKNLQRKFLQNNQIMCSECVSFTDKFLLYYVVMIIYYFTLMSSDVDRISLIFLSFHCYASWTFVCMCTDSAHV